MMASSDFQCTAAYLNRFFMSCLSFLSCFIFVLPGVLFQIFINLQQHPPEHLRLLLAHSPEHQLLHLRCDGSDILDT